MNIIFLTVAEINDINSPGIYEDLIKELVARGHEVTIICSKGVDKGFVKKESSYKNLKVYRTKTFAYQKNSSWLIKGVALLSIEYSFLYTIIKNDALKKYDLILSATPPITFNNIVKILKFLNKAKFYLLLKDIFPQNAVDMGLFRANSLIHKYFRIRERKLYSAADKIGCMSKRNVDYLIKNNPYLNQEHVEVNPNSLNPNNFENRSITKRVNKHKIPNKRCTFVYGGNLGVAQGLKFYLEVISEFRNNKDILFVIVGNGTEVDSIKEYKEDNNLNNLIYLPQMSRYDYLAFLDTCDVGVVLLDSKFSIPNYPSRILTYMGKKLPILCITDVNSDVGLDAKVGDYGVWSIHGNIKDAVGNVKLLLNSKEMRKRMGENSFKKLQKSYDVKHSIDLIESSLYD